MQKSEKEQKKKLKARRSWKKMKRQKLDLEKTIETFKKSLCEEKIASVQQNGRDHVTKAESFTKMLKEKEVLCHGLSA